MNRTGGWSRAKILDFLRRRLWKGWKCSFQRRLGESPHWASTFSELRSGRGAQIKVIQRRILPFDLSHLFVPFSYMQMGQQVKMQKPSLLPKICSVKKIRLLLVWDSTVKPSDLDVLWWKEQHLRDCVCLHPKEVCQWTCPTYTCIHPGSIFREKCLLRRHTYPVAENRLHRPYSATFINYPVLPS